MTPFTQNITPRRRAAARARHFQSRGGDWHVRALRSRGTSFFTFTPFERGSVTQATITVVFSLMSLVSVALLGFFYLQQVLNTASQGSDIQGLESRVLELREQQRALELQGATLRSMQAVEERVDKLNLVATDRVAYLASPPGHVAIAE